MVEYSIKTLPKHEALEDGISLIGNELQKYFPVGNHVKFLNERFKDETKAIV